MELLERKPSTPTRRRGHGSVRVHPPKLKLKRGCLRWRRLYPMETQVSRVIAEVAPPLLACSMRNNAVFRCKALFQIFGAVPEHSCLTARQTDLAPAPLSVVR